MEPLPEATKQPQKRKKSTTWEHPKGSGIKVAEMVNRTGGRVYNNSFQVRIPAKLSGRREMHQRPTKQEAERLAEDRFVALKKHGTEFSKIPPSVQKEAAVAWAHLFEHNTKGQHSLGLLEAVKAGIKALSPTGGARTFASVAAEMRASKKARLDAGGFDGSSERDFRTRSLRIELAGLGPKLVSQIKAGDIEAALTNLKKLDGKKLSGRSILNFRRIMAEIFSHAVAKQYTATNPLDQFAKEDIKRLGGEQARDIDAINKLSPTEAEQLLKAGIELGDTGLLATLVLRLFCGLRTGEVSKLDWSEVHWLDPKPFVHIAAGKAKKRNIRHITIPENALAWLKLCNPKASGPVDTGSYKTYAKRFGRIAKMAGIAWENNDTRHSFGSYHYALHGDSIRTAKEMGHKQGDDVLFAHYRQLVRKEEAEAYFNLLPPVTAGNISQFPHSVASA
jgi:integrase